MQFVDAPSSLRSHLQERSLELEQTAPLTLFESVIDWYESERVEDAAAIEDDGDMLLFQWGTWDWGDGPTFQYNLTRQLVTGNHVDDQEIWQLWLTAHYKPTPELARLGSANRWCGSPSECDDLRTAIHASPATAEVGGIHPLRFELTFERV